jgi:signal transduction histidine kinase
LAHGKLVLKPIPLDLVHVVDQSIDGLRSQATKAGCEIVLSSAGPVRGIWDRLRMEQVFMNLLSNALKYGAGHPVEVRVVADENTATVEISDRGTGIPEPDLERIFDRFERASSLRHYGGLGLGLYVSREIVRGHAGSVHAANRPGGGATFTVRLPMQRDPVAPKSAGEC